MRQIKFKDVFQLSKIIKKINVKKIISDNRNDIDMQGKSEEEVKSVLQEKGLEIIIDLLANAGDAEVEIMKLIADFSECKSQEVENWGVKDLKKFIEDFTKINSFEEIKDFFSSAMG